jgi:hypothetical protein
MPSTAEHITKLKLIKAVAQPKWVRASVICKLTGWNGDDLKQARVDGSITARTERGIVWYDLNTLHPYHLKTAQ